MAGNDFVFVQLSAQGALQAGGHPLRVSGRVSIEFTPGKPVRVAKYEWDLMLKSYETSHGLPLFELVEAPTVTSTPAPAFVLPAVPEKPKEAK